MALPVLHIFITVSSISLECVYCRICWQYPLTIKQRDFIDAMIHFGTKNLVISISYRLVNVITVLGFTLRYSYTFMNLLGNVRHIWHHLHTGKCIRPFGGIYAYCRYFIDRKW